MDAIKVNDGSAVSYHNDSGSNIECGDIVVLANAVGVVAQQCIADGEDGTVLFSGCFDVVKEPTVAITFGAIVYWDAVNKEADIDSGNSVVLGICVKRALDSDERVRVWR